MYTIYKHETPDRKIYIGYCSTSPQRRWQCGYKGSSLQEHIDKWGWSNIIHSILDVVETRFEARLMEDFYINLYKDRIINKVGSGVKFPKMDRSSDEWKVYNRVARYNLDHPDEIKESPLVAKRRFKNEGYIPTYIKNDDLRKEEPVNKLW